MKSVLPFVGLVAVLVVAGPAAAYIGPGAGLGLVSSLVAVLAATVMALALLLVWPVRMLVKRRRAKRPVGLPPRDRRDIRLS